MSSVTPRLSVVMATYNRAETLRRTLEHLDAQDLDPQAYEVIVVDDGSPDDTRGVVTGKMPEVRFELSLLHHANRGPGYTQNRGIRAARAPIVTLMADDIFMTPGALAAHLAAHEAHAQPNVAALGCVLQSPDLDQSVFLRTWDPFQFKALGRLEWLPPYMFWACNISFKRDFMLEHGMFREQRGRAGAAAHEDAELGCRLGRKGLRIRYAPEALAHHYHLETLDGAMRRAYQRGLNWDEFKQHVPEPEVTVRYHVLHLRTLGDHLRAMTGPGRRNLLGADRSVILLTLRYLLRFLGFNRLAVRRFWIPLLRRAESSPWLARRMRSVFYRGVISHHFFKGCRDAVKRFPATGATSSTA